MTPEPNTRESEPTGVVPFGTHALRGWQNALAAISHRKNRRPPGVARTLLNLRRSLAKRLLRLSGARPPYDVEPWPGMKLRLDPRDNTTDRHVLSRDRVWSDEDAAAIERAATEAPDGRLHYVDVGANTGIYAAYVAQEARRAGAELSAICIEPQPVAVSRLKDNLAFSGIGPDAVRPVAVGPEGTLTLDVSVSKNMGKAHARATDADGPVLKVPSRPLASLVAEADWPRVDLMKLDIEGLEPDVLEAFFADAPEASWPGTILTEIVHDKAGRLATLLPDHGYRRVHADATDAVYVRQSA